MLKIYLTNLGKYNEGYLIGEWVKLPCTDEELEEVKKRIGINKQYEEWFITDYETDIEGVEVGEYDSIDELNELAEQIEDFNECDIEIIEAIIEATGYNLSKAIDIKDEVDYYPGYDLEDLAEEFVDKGIFGVIPDSIANYIEYRAIARDLEYDYTETSQGVIRIS